MASTFRYRPGAPRLPVPYLYVPFQSSPVNAGPFEGVYGFEGKAPNGERSISLAFMTKSWSSTLGRNGLLVQIAITDEEAPLGTFIDEGLAMIIANEESKSLKAEFTAFAKAHMDYLMKLFLYMALQEAHRVPCRERSEHEARLARLGPRKAAKLMRKPQDNLYDRIEVGPKAWPEADLGEEDSYEVSPHWRKGHFRHQPCGPCNQERKLIFVKPVMVRADRLAVGG